MAETTTPAHFDFETHPSRYRHMKLVVDGPIARIQLNVNEDAGLAPGYVLKLNSYDLGVDIELNDAVQRLRFSHPGVSVVVVESLQPGIFSAGANIFMLGRSTHAFKVNFCKYTNETRLYLEDATKESGQTYVCAVSGIASGGGYELALACDKIYLIDDRRSAVALPEVPYLAVLPGTGGLTRVVDKRKVRKDRADIFCTLAEGIKGKRAKDWNLVDDVFPSSRFADEVTARAKALVAPRGQEKGVELEALQPEVSATEIRYRYVRLALDEKARTARLTLEGPKELPPLPKHDSGAPPAFWYPLRAFRELDDALLRLRFNHPLVNVVLLETRGDVARVLELDAQLWAARDQWLVREVLGFQKRVLKRLDLTAKSFFAMVDKGSCFAGTLAELLLAADRVYMLDDESVQVALSEQNGGIFPMSNGLSRLDTRWLAEPERARTIAASRQKLGATEAEAAGIATLAVEPLDWDDETRMAIEERAALSPDALTGMEASLRFAGPETLETKIFGRLSAWQNWIFQRPNAVGERGALKLYGSPTQPEFDWNRT
jgi:benzoyl-CoA-dihydrodiol lyase